MAAVDRTLDEPEWDRARKTLSAAGIDPTDFGRFVNNTAYFEPSRFDERGAMPVLLSLLPSLTRPAVVRSVAAHLRRPWARPDAYPALRTAFVAWAALDADTGWHLGDALVTAATLRQTDDLIALVRTQEYGRARQMIVDALWRFKKDARVEALLKELVRDETVALHAMSALRRCVGSAAALPVLRALLEDPSPLIRKQAQTQVRRAEKAEPK